MLDKTERVKRFEYLFEQYSRLLYRIALSFLHSAHDSEDAVQDTFIKYLSSPFEYHSDVQERAWLVRVLNNTCRDMLRRRNTREGVNLDELENIGVEDETAVGVFDALSKLGDKYRAVILLHYLEGFSVDEIAISLSLSKSAVKMRLMRGREELAKILGRENTSVQ